jgi:hypothetical protein
LHILDSILPKFDEPLTLKCASAVAVVDPPDITSIIPLSSVKSPINKLAPLLLIPLLA